MGGSAAAFFGLLSQAWPGGRRVSAAPENEHALAGVNEEKRMNCHAAIPCSTAGELFIFSRRVGALYLHRPNT